MISIFERVEQLRALWTMAIPKVAPPENTRLAAWCDRFTDDELQHGFLRGGKAVHKGKVIPETSEVCRYISGVLANESKQAKGGKR